MVRVMANKLLRKYIFKNSCLPAVFLLCEEERAELGSLLGRKVSNLLHIDAEGEKELLLEVHQDEVVAVEDLAEAVQLLQAAPEWEGGVMIQVIRQLKRKLHFT